MKVDELGEDSFLVGQRCVLTNYWRWILLKQITINPDVCTGCRACEVACSFAHTDLFSPDLARIRVAKNEHRGLDFPITCRMCARPMCVEVCPTDALARDPADRHIMVDDDECVGCGLCADACPHSAIQFHPETGVPLICDLCGGDPACVKRCVLGAIRFERNANLRSRKRLELGEKVTGKGGCQ